MNDCGRKKVILGRPSTEACAMGDLESFGEMFFFTIIIGYEAFLGLNA